MPGLREVQERFSANVLDADAVGIAADVKAGAFEPRLRLQVYRNNVFTGLTDALRAVYPVVEKLVGEGFFLYASNEFIKRNPSTSGDLHAFGSGFGSFLATFEPAKKLSYLPDVAQLEWNYHEVYHEADADAMDVDALQLIAPDQYERLQFRLNPACRLMQSVFPVIEIWRVNQEGYSGDQTVDLDAGAVNVLLLRQGEEIELHPLDAGDYAMLAMFARGDQLGDCLGAAQRIDAAFDLTGFLSRFVGNRALIDFTAC